jgi:hypothetical protein
MSEIREDGDGLVYMKTAIATQNRNINARNRRVVGGAVSWKLQTARKTNERLAAIKSAMWTVSVWSSRRGAKRLSGSTGVDPLP